MMIVHILLILVVMVVMMRRKDMPVGSGTRPTANTTIEGKMTRRITRFVRLASEPLLNAFLEKPEAFGTVLLLGGKQHT